ncbi:hypothetical protein [Neolewinella persica]|uniref:hypothetical protein n=1 Tax=Neolewinella persica TaxID=70998 RepID=UPI0003746FC4|nr:hypothetical protein [Neolewinella persica]
MSAFFSPLAIAFLGTTILAIYFFARAHRTPRKVAFVLLGYSIVQYIVGATGFYEYTESLPPHFLLNILPTLIAIFWLFFSKEGNELLAGFDRTELMWVHFVRVPVELVLYGLFIAGQIPEIMTFAGNNFDIVMGLTAPAIIYFGYGKKWITPGLIRIWHIVGLVLLFNIIITAILSAPFPFQQFGFEQPNVGILQAPFNLLAAVVAPLVLVAHFIGLGRRKK